MRLRLGIFALMAFFAVLQTTVVPYLFVLAGTLPPVRFLSMHTVDLVLLTVIYISFTRSFWSALIWACIATVLIQSFGISWKGSMHFAFFSVALGVNLVKRHVVAKTFAQKCFMGFALSVLSAGMQLFFGGTFERFEGFLSGMVLFFLTQALIDGFFAHAVFKVIFSTEKIIDKRILRKENVFFTKELGYGLTSL